MGVDLIEMATKAMAGLPVTEYPATNIPKDYGGVFSGSKPFFLLKIFFFSFGLKSFFSFCSKPVDPWLLSLEALA